MNERLKDFVIVQASAAFARSVWFEDEVMKVYVRAGKSGSYTRTGACLAICVSNIEILDEANWRKGIFSNLVQELIALGRKKDYTEFQIENASTPHMIGWCKKNELLVKPPDPGGWPDCYYMPI